ncbi:MAG: cytochrome c3 family protein [bacterium]
MKVTVAIITVVAVMIFVGSAMAVPAGKSIDYESSAGKVIFDGKTHADKGAKCNDCHPALYQMKKGATKATMADMGAGKSCGACHNGTKAFKANDPANCAKCHKK